MGTNAEYMRRYRETSRGRMQVQVNSRANNRAATWVKQNRPDVWEAILEAAWNELAGWRPPLGRPKEKRDIPL